jgi:hypothetical protein
VLGWDPAALEGLGTFALTSAPGPNPSFSLDMRTASTLDTSQHPDLATGAYVVWSDASAVSVEGGAPLPDGFALRGPFPNPFTQRTRLVLDLPEAAEVSVEVFDVLGRRVLALPAQALAAGAAQPVPVDASALPAGAYLYRLIARTGGTTEVVTGRLTRLE